MTVLRSLGLGVVGTALAATVVIGVARCGSPPPPKATTVAAPVQVRTVYAEHLHTGKKILVRWVDAIGRKNATDIKAEHLRWVEWMAKVRETVQGDYGAVIAESVLLGIPRNPIVILGSSEPWELEAQLARLDGLIRQPR